MRFFMDVYTKELMIFEGGKECSCCGDVLEAPKFGVTTGYLIDCDIDSEFGWRIDSEACELTLRGLRGDDPCIKELSKLEVLLEFGFDPIELHDQIVEKRKKN